MDYHQRFRETFKDTYDSHYLDDILIFIDEEIKSAANYADAVGYKNGKAHERASLASKVESLLIKRDYPLSDDEAAANSAIYDVLSIIRDN